MGSRKTCGQACNPPPLYGQTWFLGEPPPTLPSLTTWFMDNLLGFCRDQSSESIFWVHEVVKLHLE